VTDNKDWLHHMVKWTGHITHLVRRGRPAGRRGTVAARRSGRNERLVVGMAFVDMSREEIREEEEYGRSQVSV
jgi:hypothetical protein